MKLIFDEVGCDWIIIAEVMLPYDSDTLHEALETMVAELNAGLDALAGGTANRIGVRLEK